VPTRKKEGRAVLKRNLRYLANLCILFGSWFERATEKQNISEKMETLNIKYDIS